MLLSRHELESLIKQDDEGRFYAEYHGLTLHSLFQPIFSFNKTVKGYEALLRMYDENDNLVRADYFFQNAHVSLNLKTIIESLSQIIHLRNFAHSPIREQKIFINSLPRSTENFLHSHTDTHFFIPCIEELDLDPQKMVIELVEFEANCNQSLATSVAYLKELGFIIAVDDFGVQASNETRAKLINPGIIKFDKSILKQYMMGSTEGMHQALELCEQIKAQALVEGVESEQQLSAIADLNIDMFQGFHLAKPQKIQVQHFTPALSAIAV